MATKESKERKALERVVLLLEDSEPWARNYLRQAPSLRLVDLDRMAASIVDAVALARGVLAPIK
jgi:hypothetical protein